ncbi:3-beta-glucosidase 1-like protein [Raphanus sativus]|nr:3-beta-glucosidase 1-like protein [Raphanus sativus]
MLIRIIIALLLFISATFPQNSEASSGRWCVANPHIPDQVVQAAAEWACQQSVACCSRIQLGQNCFLPNTIKDHASVVFNTYYQNYKHQGGSCDFNGAAVITDTDPSHGSCQFESAPDSNTIVLSIGVLPLRPAPPALSLALPATPSFPASSQALVQGGPFRFLVKKR